MSRTRRSLSPIISFAHLEGSRTVYTVPEKSNGNAQNASDDLEDGEITDEVDLEEANSEAVEGIGEGVDQLKSSLKEDDRLDGEQVLEQLEHQHEENTVAEPNTPDVEISLNGSEEHSGTDSFPYQTPISSLFVSNPFPTTSHRALSEEELELAKDVVLDLLGWGVQPEYLIECGVSSYAIYRIFTDLRLRLPSNLSYLGPG